MYADESSADERLDDAPLAERESPMPEGEDDNWEGDSAVGGVQSYAYDFLPHCEPSWQRRPKNLTSVRTGLL